MQGRWRPFLDELRGDGGWRVVLASAIGYGLGLNVLPFYTLGAFVVPLEAAFGWSRAQVQGALGFLVLATLVGGWGTGWAADRLGVRKVALVAQLGLGIGLALLGLAPAALWYWYAVWFLMSLIGLGTSPIIWTRAIAGWFDAGRGFALAIALCGSGIVALLAPAGAVMLIEAWGWRACYIALGAVVLLIAIPASLWIMPKPSIRPGVAGRATGVVELPGLNLGEAIRGHRFWVLVISSVILGFAVSGIIPNLVPMVVDRGIAPAVAASLLGVLGVAIIVGRLAAGFALDRVWAPIVAAVLLPLPAISCLLLAQGATDYLVLAGAVTLLGFATGAEFDLVPYMVTRYFGMRRYGQIYALQWIGWTVSAGVAPAIFGHVHDRLGTYSPILYAAALCFLAAPVMLLTLGRYPRFANAALAAGGNHG